MIHVYGGNLIRKPLLSIHWQTEFRQVPTYWTQPVLHFFKKVQLASNPSPRIPVANEGSVRGFPSLKKCHVILVVISILGGGVDPRSTLNQITPAMGSHDPTEPFPSEWLVSMRPLPSSSMRLMRVVPNEREELPGTTGKKKEFCLELGMMGWEWCYFHYFHYFP